MTLNEPQAMAYNGKQFKKKDKIVRIGYSMALNLGYGVGAKAPGVIGSGTKDYIAGHNQLRAHARAYRLYESKYKPTQNGIK